MWFEELTGFREQSHEQVRANLTLNDDRLTSTANGRTLVCGKLETPSLAELRSRAATENLLAGQLQLSEVVADVQKLHIDPANSNAVFQVASQFNLLEMVSPSVSPEDGIDRYESDRTQGPACAIACGAGTIYRNYFAETNGQVGQTADNQIDCLRDLGAALGNDGERLWSMRNGYALASADGLGEISSRLSSMGERERDNLRSLLRVGIQWNTQVTLSGASHLVSQVYGSALPVAYSNLSRALWSDFASLILEASYESVLLAGVLNAAKTGSRRVYLTLLGGGAFGNAEAWITAAIERSLRLFANSNLDIAIVSYGRSKPQVQKLATNWRRDC